MRLFLFSILCCCTFGVSTAQEASYLPIENYKYAYNLASYAISDVVYVGPDPQQIGAVKQGGKTVYTILLQPGITDAVKTYLSANTTQDPKQTPVQLRIQKLKADGRKTSNQCTIDATLVLGFYIGEKKLVEFTNSAHLVAPVYQTDSLSNFISKTIISRIKNLDDWWGQHKTTAVINDTVIATVTIAPSNEDKDKIVYSTTTPLKIADFKGDTSQSKGDEMAMTNSGFSMEFNSEVKNGTIYVHVTLCPYFSISKSWFKHAEQPDYLLAHEQGHFDITALKTCEMAETIRKTHFTKENYADLLKDFQTKFGNEAVAEEDKYDGETNHSIVVEKQLEWTKLLREQIAQSHCY